MNAVDTVPWLMPSHPPSSLPQPIPARSVAPQDPAHLPAEGTRLSGPEEQLRRSMVDSSAKQSTMSMLAKAKPRATSMRKMLMNTGNGDVIKLKGNRQKLLDRVSAHRGPVYIMGNDGQPLFVFKRNETTHEWEGYSGVDGERLRSDQSEPDKVLVQMMGQGLGFSGYGFVDWRPVGGAGGSQSAPTSPSLPPVPGEDEERRRGSELSQLVSRHARLVSPSRLTSRSSVSVPSTSPSRRASIHTVRSDELDEPAEDPRRPVSPLSPLVLAPQPHDSSEHPSS